MKSPRFTHTRLGPIAGIGALILVLALFFSTPNIFADVAGQSPEELECIGTQADNHDGLGEDADHGLPDCDARDPFEPAGRPDEEQQNAIRRLAEDGATVRWNDIFGTPKMIINYGDFLTEEDARCPAERGCPEQVAEEIALNYLEQNNLLFKADPLVPDPDPVPVGVLGSLGASVDFQDVDGPPFVVGSVYNGPNNASHVFLEQLRGGFPVFGSVLNLTIDPEGHIVLVGSQYDRNGIPAGAFDTSEEAAATAVLRAAAAAGVEDADQFDLGESTQEGQVHQFENPFGPETMLEPLPITAEPVVFPMPFGVDNRWAWLVTIQVDFAEVYEIAIDANTGDLLFRRNQVHADGPRGTVFTGQNPCQGGDVNTCSLLTPMVVDFTGWVDPAPNFTTRGNNANVVHNPAGDDTNEGGPVDADQHFDYAYTDAIRTSGGTDVLD